MSVRRHPASSRSDRDLLGQPSTPGAQGGQSRLQQGDLVFWDGVFTAVVGLGPGVLLQVFLCNRHKTFKLRRAEVGGLGSCSGSKGWPPGPVPGRGRPPGPASLAPEGSARVSEQVALLCGPSLCWVLLASDTGPGSLTRWASALELLPATTQRDLTGDVRDPGSRAQMPSCFPSAGP